MKINEVIYEAITPIEPVAPVGSVPNNPQPATGTDTLGQYIDQEENPVEEPTLNLTPPANMKGVIDTIRAAAANEPVKSTGNPGLDTLLFKRAALAKGVSGIANAIGKGLGRMGSAFAAQSGGVKRIANFDRKMRSGAEMRLGAGANKVGLSATPNAPKTIAPGQTSATGIKQISPQRLVPTKMNGKQVEHVGDMDSALIIAAGKDPIGLTGNPGVDELLNSAMRTQEALLKQQQQTAQQQVVQP